MWNDELMSILAAEFCDHALDAQAAQRHEATMRIVWARVIVRFLESSRREAVSWSRCRCDGGLTHSSHRCDVTRQICFVASRNAVWIESPTVSTSLKQSQQFSDGSLSSAVCFRRQQWRRLHYNDRMLIRMSNCRSYSVVIAVMHQWHHCLRNKLSN